MRTGALLEGRAVATANLIPYNPTGVGTEFSTSSEEQVEAFQMLLRRSYRINTTVRQQMGQDIDGACGQLVLASADGDKVTGVADIEDVPRSMRPKPEPEPEPESEPEPEPEPESADPTLLPSFLDRAESDWGVRRAPARKALTSVDPGLMLWAIRQFEAEMTSGREIRNPTGLLIQTLRSKVWVEPT